MVEESRRYLAEGQFPSGSMGRKMQAAVEFVDQGGKRAVVCRPEGVAAGYCGRNSLN